MSTPAQSIIISDFPVKNCCRAPTKPHSAAMTRHSGAERSVIHAYPKANVIQSRQPTAMMMFSNGQTVDRVTDVLHAIFIMSV